jgi:arylsulfatase A-like enzyme
MLHSPLCPPSDHPDFISWHGNPEISNSGYFPDMVTYLDKQIGSLADTLKAMGLAKETHILITTDNGTSNKILETFNGLTRPGGTVH